MITESTNALSTATGIILDALKYIYIIDREQDALTTVGIIIKIKVKKGV